MKTFHTKVNGIPCLCKVLFYSPGRAMRINGPGFDADPPEDPYFEYKILDRNGVFAPWLEKYVTPEKEEELLEDYLIMRKAR